MNVANLPPTKGPDRNAAVLARVLAGDFDPIVWAPVTSTWNGHTATFSVFARPISFDGVRVSMGSTLIQQMADAFAIRGLPVSMLTARLFDLMHLQRATVPGSSELFTLLPHSQSDLSQSTASYEVYSSTLDGLIAQAGGAPNVGILSSLGKTWVLDNDSIDVASHIGRACNYGWYWPVAGAYDPAVTAPLRVIQSRGWRHTVIEDECDYSQLGWWAALACMLDGQPANFVDVASNPDTCGLVNHANVPLRVLRQPGVAVWSPASASFAAEVWQPLGAPTVAMCPVKLPPLVNIVPWDAAITPALTAWAATMPRSYAIGTQLRDTVAGMPVIGRVECSPPTSPAAPWSKGIALYHPAQPDGGGVLRPILTPPAGWPGSIAA